MELRPVCVHACMLNCFSPVWLFVTPWTVAHKAPLSMGFSRQNTGVGCHSLLQELFMGSSWTRDWTWVSRIAGICPLSHQGSPETKIASFKRGLVGARLWRFAFLSLQGRFLLVQAKANIVSCLKWPGLQMADKCVLASQTISQDFQVLLPWISHQTRVGWTSLDIPTHNSPFIGHYYKLLQ